MMLLGTFAGFKRGMGKGMNCGGGGKGGGDMFGVGLG